MRRALVRALGVGLLAATSVPLEAQLAFDPRVLSTTPDPKYPTERQLAPVVASLRAGSLLVWEEDRRGIVAGWFDADGAPRGEVRVLAASDPYPPLPFRGALHEQREPAIAVRADGSFVLAWTDWTVQRALDVYTDQRDPQSARVMARSFAADGSPQGERVEIGPGSKPAVAVSGRGALVGWQAPAEGRHAVRIRSWSGEGTLGEAASLGDDARPPVMVGGKGSTLVVWEPMTGGLRARLVDDAGAPLGSTPELGAADGAAPAVAWDGRGQFLVAWQRATASASAAVRGQLLGASGKPAGPPFVVSPAGDEARSPAVAPLPGGGWGVAWLSWRGASRVAVKAAALDAKGRARGTPLVLSTAEPPTDELAAASGDRGFVVAWPAYSSAGRLVVQARQSARSR